MVVQVEPRQTGPGTGDFGLTGCELLQGSHHGNQLLDLMREEEVIAALDCVEVAGRIGAPSLELTRQHARHHAMLGADTTRDDARHIIDARPDTGPGTRL